MSFLADLRREWVSIQVPGTQTVGPYATFVRYPGDQLPAPPADVADLRWLERAPRHPRSALASAEKGVRDLTRDGLAEVLGGDATLPGDLERFLEGDGLRDRLRGATGSYFDLGDAAVQIPGGRLLHLISESHYIYHWMLYLGDDGTSAVVGSEDAAGFEAEDDEDLPICEQWRWEYVVVADSFAEFLWRWWMDNEIVHQVGFEKSGFSAEQRAYVAQYGPPRRFRE